jgi:Protein of unknown function (DUF998)
MISRTWARIRLGSAVASFPVFVVGILVLGWVTPGYSQLADPVSRLASPGERWAPEAMAILAAYGGLMIVGSGSLRAYGRQRANMLSVLLASYGVACIVVAIAPKNQPGSPPTLVSQVHVNAAVIAGALLLGATVVIARCAASKRIRCAAIAIAVLIPLGVGVLRLTWGTHIYGLNERLLLGLGMGWLSALAALRGVPVGCAIGQRRRQLLQPE